MEEAPPMDAADLAAEAARYAVLRRLGPALRHDLVVNLQAVAMMAEVLGARLEKGPPRPPDLQQQVGRIHRMVREAVGNSLKVAAWLTPPADDEGIGLREGVEECLALVRSNFGFRGFTLGAQVTDTSMEVSHARLRLLLLAGLICLSDESDEPAELAVRADVESGAARLILERRPLPGQAGQAAEDAGYRRLGPGDLRALAVQAAVDLQQQAGRIVMHLARLVPSTPLQIAPR